MAEVPTEPDFTLGDILKEFEDEFGPPSDSIEQYDCYTSSELTKMWGLSEGVVRRKLRKLREEKRLIETSKNITPMGRPGTMYPVPAYQIKEKASG